jgi:hypothetical protein
VLFDFVHPFISDYIVPQWSWAEGPSTIAYQSLKLLSHSYLPSWVNDGFRKTCRFREREGGKEGCRWVLGRVEQLKISKGFGFKGASVRRSDHRMAWHCSRFRCRSCSRVR